MRLPPGAVGAVLYAFRAVSVEDGTLGKGQAIQAEALSGKGEGIPFPPKRKTFGPTRFAAFPGKVSGLAAGRPVVIVEGQIDALAMGALWGLPALAVGGANALPVVVERLAEGSVRGRRFVVVADDDAPGTDAAREAVRRARKLLMRVRFRIRPGDPAASVEAVVREALGRTSSEAEAWALARKEDCPPFASPTPERPAPEPVVEGAEREAPAPEREGPSPAPERPSPTPERPSPAPERPAPEPAPEHVVEREAPEPAPEPEAEPDWEPQGAEWVHPEWAPEPAGGWAEWVSARSYPEWAPESEEEWAAQFREICECLSSLAEAHPLWHFGGTSLPDLLTWADIEGQAEDGPFAFRAGESEGERLRRLEPDINRACLHVLGWHSWPLLRPPEMLPGAEVEEAPF